LVRGLNAERSNPNALACTSLRDLEGKTLSSWWRKLKAGFNRPLKLRTHLTLLTVSTLLPIIFFTLVIAVFLARREQETFQRGATERTKALLTAVDKELEGSISTLVALSTDRNLEQNNLRGFAETLARVLQSQRDWVTISLAEPSGQQVINVLRPFGTPLPMLGERSSFDQVLRTGKPAVGHVVQGPITNHYQFSIRVPVIQKGVIKYVLSAVEKPDTFRVVLAPQRLPPDWVGVILDGNNRFVARTMDPERYLGQPASQSLQAALGLAFEGWFRGDTLENIDMYTSYNRSSFSGWSVALGIPASTVDASLHRSLFSVLLLGLASLGSGMVLVWFFSAPIARSIRSLSGIAENLGQGKVQRTNIDPSPVSEVEDVRQALLKANQLIRERSDERDRVETTLRQVTERLELAQEAANVGSFERDLVSDDTVWSASQEKLYGLAPGTFGGKLKEWAERVHPADLPAVEAAIRHAIETKSSLNLQFRIIRSNGEMRWLTSQARVFVDEQGNPRRLIGVNIDITERKRAEDDLARSRNEFERMAVTSPDFLFIYDLVENRNVYENKHVEEYLGYPVGQLPITSGHITDELLHPEDLSAVREQYRHFGKLAAGEVLEWECRLRHADGKYRWFQVRATVFERAEDGSARRIIGHSRDMTTQKQAETALKRFNEDLERCVVEQTAKLMEINADLLREMEQRQKLEDQLRQSQKMEAIGTLAGGIAHDFNNILGIILGYTQELLNSNGEDPENRIRNLEVISEAAERGAKVVKQLLTFARKTGVEHKPLDVNALIRETLDILRQIFPKTIILHFDLDPAIPVLQGDSNQLQQALINICLNAKDAMPAGGRLSLSTRPVPAAESRRYSQATDDYIRIDVSDNGFGMDDQTRERAFEPFFTTKKDGGTGLGLAVVYGIVQTHRGFINLARSKEGGTSVQIFLPVPAKANLSLESQANGHEEVSSIGGTILLVDDEALLLELVRLSAEKRGFRVFTAHDGEEAVEVYQKHAKEIDVVVLDWGLPRLDGRAVFRKLKEMNPKVKVIGISGYLEFDLRDRMLKEGVRDFLQKPCTPNEILEKVLLSSQAP
jgi:PAS domain S-box-containing protein